MQVEKGQTKISQNHLSFIKFHNLKNFFYFVQYCSAVPVDVITHGTYIPTPFTHSLLLCCHFGELVASTLTKKNTVFANFSFFPFINARQHYLFSLLPLHIYLHRCLTSFGIVILQRYNDKSLFVLILMLVHHKGNYFTFLNKHNW